MVTHEALASHSCHSAAVSVTALTILKNDSALTSGRLGSKQEAIQWIETVGEVCQLMPFSISIGWLEY